MGLSIESCALCWLALVSGCTSQSELGQFEPRLDAGLDSGAGESGSDASVHLEPLHTRLALGAASSCALDSTGKTSCWGDNVVGQLGTGSELPEMSDSPLPVGGLPPGVRAIFGGAVATCAVDNDGHALCWGDSVFGQFEGMPGVHAISYSPLEAPGLSSVVSMGIGTYFHCALNVEGTVKCYGLNGAGQLGTGSLDDSYTPASVVGLDKSFQLTASQSGFFACAATLAGGAFCWGSNDHGQLGNNSTSDALKPVAVAGLASGVTALTAGREHACAIVSKSVRCWGSNAEGQLADSSGLDHKTPFEVPGLPPIKSIAAGATHTCALSETGSVYCWGSITSSASPTVAVPSGAIELGAGGGHACALLPGEILECWGEGSRGQLGPFSGAGAPL